MLELLRYALLDSKNDKFIFLRTLTFPIQPFEKFYKAMEKQTKSIILT